MKTLVEFFGEHRGTIIIGAVFYVLGLISRPNNKAKPSYNVKSLLVLTSEGDEAPSEVKIYFGKEQIQKLTKETFRFWNHGGKALREENIDPDDPIKIVFKDGVRILACEKVKKTKDVSRFELIKSPQNQNIREINLNYLNSKNGALYNIWHDGDAGDFIVKGKIIDVTGGVANLTYDESFERKAKYVGKWFLAVWGILIAAAFILIIAEIYPFGLEETDMPHILLIILMLGVFVIQVALLAVQANFFWRVLLKKHPKSLNVGDTPSRRSLIKRLLDWFLR